MHRLNTKTRLIMLCLSGFELYSRWVPLKRGKMEAKKGESPSKISSPLAP